MIKKDVIDLNVAFTALKELGGTKFKYAMSKNTYVLKNQLTALIEVEKTINDSISLFTEARNNLIVELGTKDDKGGAFVDPNDKELMKIFNDRLTLLIDEHKIILDKYNKQIVDFEDILKETVDETIDFRKVEIDELPDEGISTKDMDLLIQFNIIKD